MLFNESWKVAALIPQEKVEWQNVYSYIVNKHGLNYLKVVLIPYVTLVFYLVICIIVRYDKHFESHVINGDCLSDFTNSTWQLVGFWFEIVGVFDQPFHEKLMA